MNQEDKDRFFAGSSTWNEHFQQPGSWTTRYKADLSGQKLWEDNATGESGAEVYDDVDLSGCDLHDADFGAPGGFDLTRASFAYSNVRGCNLAGAVLTDADFTEADLTEAVLDGATLDRTNLATTTLTGAVLARSRPWRARLFQPPAHAPTPPVTTNTIGSVGDLVGEHSPLVGGRAKNSTATLYYRGESQRFALRPSVMRRRAHKDREGRMLLDLMTRLPEAFEGASSALAQWVLAQHHGLSTRLLDVTRNPLVALFFACERDPDCEGRLHIFSVPADLIKPYDSDTISIVANFAKLSRQEQCVLLGMTRPAGADFTYAIDKLYHLIRQEKPQFKERMEPRDLFRVFVVEPQQAFERIRTQAGAFLMSAFHRRFEAQHVLRLNAGIPTYEHWTWSIAPGDKSRILDELTLLNVSRDTLFRDLDEAAQAINA